MDVSRKNLSVVFPVHNEADSLGELLSRLLPVLKGLNRPYEVIFVDDASTDRSWGVMKELRANNPHVRVIRFKKNCGESAALEAGFKAARGDMIVAMDADLQSDPKDIPGLLEKLKEYDVAWGLRAERKDEWLRRLVSWGGNTLRQVIMGDNARDAGSPLRVMRREVVQKVKLFKGLHRFYPTLCRMEGFKVIEIPISHFPRKFGESKYNIRNRLFKFLVDLLAVKWMQNRRIDYEVVEELDER
ncbi:MAG TPA: glycosyltransferase family 2 protein [Candidatus Tripitaka californicus]|uniref:glycosyltransferase family 2 protein n=1 Tax=Candidatus Tripitaka californicus TaxID=3367616 RepID=UPI004025D288|nr:glycosyltransferase family 2 protein [Planctomycetota bacterium]